MDRHVVAYHEAGHALVAHCLQDVDRMSHLTILPHGQSLGVTQFVAEEDRYNYSREQLMARLTVGLGGRVAEELAFGPELVTTGAENDFQAVTGLTYKDGHPLGHERARGRDVRRGRGSQAARP